MNDFAKLKAADPDPSGDLAVVTARFNDPDDADLGADVISPLSMGKVNGWGAKTGGILKIEAAALVASPIQAVCRAAMDNFNNPNIPSLDLSDEDNMLLLKAIVQANVIDQAEADVLLALATTRQSWAERNWAGKVRTGHLESARGIV